MLAESRGFFVLVWLTPFMTAASLGQSSASQVLLEFTDGVSTQQRQLANTTVTAMIANKEQLISGRYRAAGRKTIKHEILGEQVGDIKLFCAFDLSSTTMRFERTGHMLSQTIDDVDLPTGGWAFEEETGRIIITPTQIIDWNTDAFQQVAVRPFDPKYRGYAQPFDPRIIGVTTNSAYVRNTSWDKALNPFRSGLVSDCHNDGDRIRIDWSYAKGVKKTYWFDRKNGYMPLRFEMTYQDSSGQDRLWHTSVQTWTHQNDVFVPETLSVQSMELTELEQLPEQIDLAFEWESINEGIDDNLLAAEGLTTRAAAVVDTRLGTPVITDWVNRSIDSVEPSKLKNGPGFRWMLIVNLVLFFTVVLIAFFRRRRVTATKVD